MNKKQYTIDDLEVASESLNQHFKNWKLEIDRLKTYISRQEEISKNKIISLQGKSEEDIITTGMPFLLSLNSLTELRVKEFQETLDNFREELNLLEKQ